MSKESLNTVSSPSTAAAPPAVDVPSLDSLAHDIVPLDTTPQGAIKTPAKTVNITPPPSRPTNSPTGVRWPGLWSSVPALLFLALVASIHSAPPPPPAIETAPITDVRAVQETVATGVLPASQTMIVKAKTGSGYGLLEAELQPTSRVTGQAPLSGQIARVLVRRGQFVDVNDRVLELSTGPTSRRPTRVEKVQDSAEAAQVAAVHQQEDLNKRMETAKARLYEAQLRVAAARRRLTQARQMVLTLQNGGEVHLPASAASKSNSSDDNAGSRRSTRHHKTTRPVTTDPKITAQRLALRDAQHDADKAQDAASRATSKANAARLAAEAADQKVHLKQSQLDQATAAADKVQDSFEAGEAKGSDVAGARAAISNAKSALSEAAAKAADAHQEAEKQQTLAEKLQGEARHFSSRVALANQKMKLLAKAEPTREAPTATEAPPTSSESADGNGKSGHEASIGGKSDTAAVAQFVREAQAESEAAVQNANHIKSEIDDYDNKVHSTTARLDSTSKELEVAQQTVVENNIKQNLSSVRAPASGVVLSVAEIARDVEPGEAIVTIGRTDLLEARFEDNSDAWKNLKPGMLLHAFVKPASAQQDAQDDEEQQDEAPVVKSKRHRHSASWLRKQHLSQAQDVSKATKVKPVVAGRVAAKVTAGVVAGVKPAAATAPAAPTAATPTPAVEGTPIMVRLISVKEPTQPGRPAILRVNIYNPRVPTATATGRSRRQFRAGMTVMCSLQRPGHHEVVTVPAAAVIPVAGGTGLIAVLKPLAPAATPPQATLQPAVNQPATPGQAGTPPQLAALPAGSQPATSSPTPLSGQVSPQPPGQAPLPAVTPVPTPAEVAHRVEWRPVTLGATDGAHQEVEITDGLASGERIALEPVALHAFEVAHGPSATVRLSIS